MKVEILVLAHRDYCATRDEYVEDYDTIDVDVPNEEIYKVLAKEFNIPVKTMEDIIFQFDIDLKDECNCNNRIIELAEQIYYDSLG